MSNFSLINSYLIICRFLKFLPILMPQILFLITENGTLLR
jgi:hypothetical protein